MQECISRMTMAAVRVAVGDKGDVARDVTHRSAYRTFYNHDLAIVSHTGSYRPIMFSRHQYLQDVLTGAPLCQEMFHKPEHTL